MLSGHRFYEARIELRHWQLRDLVSISGDSIIYPSRSSLSKHSFDGHCSVIAELPSAPHCLATGPRENQLLCGGISGGVGQVSVVDLEGHSVTNYEVGDELVNAVAFVDNNTAVACSNDQGFYFGDLKSGWTTVSRVETGMPVNNVAVHRNLMAVCGDKSVVQIYDANRPGLIPASTLSAPLDADVGSSVAFSPCGQLLAAAFQGGISVLWDVRNTLKPLKTMVSVSHTRRRSPGAFRVAKFAGAMHDALFVSEEHGCVHMLDIRTLEHRLILVDSTLSVVEREGVCSLSQLLPETRGLAWCEERDALVIGSAEGIHIGEFPRRNWFPEFEWR